MRLFIAGIYTANFDVGGSLFSRLTEVEKVFRLYPKNLLESYHYIHKQSAVDRIRKDGHCVFLDSGAFSAFTQGVEIDLDQYCEYILRNQDIIEVASVLDGIGDPLKTWHNQKAMEANGVQPLPCFHYGEDESYLIRYIDNYEYITLGGMVPISTPQLKLWLDRIWEKYLTDANGRARIRVHGFGLTTPSLMERYPWYSVDSSSWVQIARVGGVFLPNSKVLTFSDQAPQRKVDWQHYDSLPPAMQEDVRKMLAPSGVDIERLRTIYLARWTYNMWSFSKLGESYPDWQEKTFIPEAIGLF